MAHAHSADAIFTLLRGSWKLLRSIDDHLTRTMVTGIGTAAFIQGADASILHYREDLTLTLPGGAKSSANQEYLYKLEAGKIKVYFAKAGTGEFFHELEIDPSSAERPKASASHLCIADTYKTTYTFYGNDHFKISHHATGPTQDYQHDSDYTREHDTTPLT